VNSDAASVMTRTARGASPNVNAKRLIDDSRPASHRGRSR
jgi:hypothetical protein